MTPELSALSIRRALVLTTPEQAAQGEAVLAALGPAGAGLLAGAVMHTPGSVTEAAMNALEASGADGLVAIGVGSTIGLGKALAYRTDLPQIALPTTYAGSEATPAPGHRTLVTHTFAGSDASLQSDGVFGVKNDLIASCEHLDGAETLWRSPFDFVLAPQD